MKRALPRTADDRRRVMITPEGIALPVTLASRGTRFGALALDLGIIVLAMVLTTLVLDISASQIADLAGDKLGKDLPGAQHAVEFLVIVWIAVIFLFRHGYFLLFELGPRGATPGKRITGIRIAARGNGDGAGRLTAEMVIARNLLRDIELFLPLVFLMSASDGGDMGAAGIAATAWFLIFALFPFFNADRLRAGDVIAGSWVVEAPRRKLEAAMSANPASAQASGTVFTAAELAVYGEYELQTLERMLRENRAEPLAAVHETIAAKIGRDPAAQASAAERRAFLDAYYTQLRARLETGMRMGRRKADKHAGAVT